MQRDVVNSEVSGMLTEGIKMSKVNELLELERTELVEMVSMLGLKVPATNPSKPNKTELATALADYQNKHESDTLKINGEVVEVEKTAKMIRKPVPMSALELTRKEVFRKDRVIIHDNQGNQTKDDSVTISWGNRALGGQTDIVSMNGDPQYVRVGALNNIKDAMTTIQTPKGGPGGGVQKERKHRFVVVDVAGLTEDELANLADKQRLRNAKNLG